jgi:hypothetical protein
MVKPTEPNFSGSLAGHLPPFTYAQLVTALGEPNGTSDGYKFEAEWAVELDDGSKAYIYDYKTGRSYLGEEDGIPVEDNTSWHVGAVFDWNSPQRERESDAKLVGRLTQEIRTALAEAAE